MAFIDVVQRTLGKRPAGPMGLSQDLLGALHVSQAGLKYAELSRSNRLFSGTTQGGAGIAPKTAPPTTTAGWGLFNPPSSGRCLVPVQCGVYSISGTLGLGMGLVAAVAQAPTTRPTTYASSATSSLGGAKYDSATLFFQAGTLLTTPAWVELASRSQVSAIEVGSGLVGVTDGMFVVPPDFVFTFDIVAPVGTTALFIGSVVWAEYDV